MLRRAATNASNFQSPSLAWTMFCIFFKGMVLVGQDHHLKLNAEYQRSTTYSLSTQDWEIDKEAHKEALIVWQELFAMIL
jgi:hypothetical protein